MEGRPKGDPDYENTRVKRPICHERWQLTYQQYLIRHFYIPGGILQTLQESSCLFLKNLKDVATINVLIMQVKKLSSKKPK